MSRFCAVLLILMLVSTLQASEFRASTPTLRQLAQKAGYIFAGTVLAVRKLEPAGPYSVAVMQITLQVDQAIRGVRPHQAINIRERMGLWNNGDRYREGERWLLFLYGRSRLGLTSPVAGDFGRFKIDNDGEIVLEAARVITLASDPILKTPLRTIPPRRSATVRGQDFRRAVLRAMEDE